MLLGSTEWVETHADELREHAAVYINTDGNDRGVLNMSGSHSLEQFINGVARDIEDPETRGQIGVAAGSAERRLPKRSPPNDPEKLRKELRQRADLRIEALGSGTDYTAFLDHLGIATLDLAYGGEDEEGIYHSIYDDFYWYTHFSDTGFRLWARPGANRGNFGDAPGGRGSVAVRFRESRRYGEKVHGRIWRSCSRISKRRFASATRNWTKECSRRRLIPGGQPSHQCEKRFRRTSTLLQCRTPWTRLLAAPSTISRRWHRHRRIWKVRQCAGKVVALNRELIESERRLTNADGLPRRPWYKHLLYAPGVYTGYGVKTVPGVREGD